MLGLGLGASVRRGILVHLIYIPPRSYEKGAHAARSRHARSRNLRSPRHSHAQKSPAFANTPLLQHTHTHTHTHTPQIKDHTKVDNSIVGWESQIGAWSRLEGHCVLGKDVQVKVRA